MDILSFIHIAVELGFKSLKAPTNYQEIIDSVIDQYINQREIFFQRADSALAKTKSDLGKQLLVANSPEQKAWNDFVYNVQVSIIIWEQLQNELTRLNNLEAQRDKNAAFMEGINNHIAEVAKFWDQLDIEAELQRLLDIQLQWLEQYRVSSERLQNLMTKMDNISSQIMLEVKKIQEISRERLEKAENIIQQSAQNDITSFNSIKNKLDDTASKYREELTTIRTHLAKPDLSALARNELQAKEASVSEKLGKVEKLAVKVEDLKEKTTQFLQDNQNILQAKRAQLEQTTDPQKQKQLSNEISNTIIGMSAGIGMLKKESQEFAQTASNLSKEGVLSDKSLDDLMTNIKNDKTVEKLNEVTHYKEDKINQHFDNIENFLSDINELKKEQELLNKEQRDLEGKMKLNKMHIGILDRNFKAKLPPPSNNNTPHTPKL